GAARVWVPVFVGVMSGIFAMYLSTKGLSRIWSPEAYIVLLIGVAFAFGGWALSSPLVGRHARSIGSRSRDIARLFRIPLLFATALLSFAHGANDVANAVGPLAGIVASVSSGGPPGESVTLPF